MNTDSLSKGYIDLHTHILAGLDDGSRDWHMSLDMCRMAWEDGTSVIVASPHYSDDVPEKFEEKVRTGIETLNAKLKEAHIDLEVLPGADISFNHYFITNWEVLVPLTINKTGKYALLEIPSQMTEQNVKEGLFQLIIHGIVPIITHPERVPEVQKDPDKLITMLRQGALCQITASSLTGVFGTEAKKCALLLLKRRLVHFIASDAHSNGKRSPVLSKAVEEASKVIGEEEALQLVTTNPRAVIEGQAIINTVDLDEQPPSGFAFYLFRKGLLPRHLAEKILFK